MGHYVLMEEYFMRISVAKAETLDSIDEELTQATSSMVDDVFFIIKKCLRRALSSGSADVTCAMLNHTTAILDEEYHDILKARLNNAAGFAAWGSLDFNQAYSLVQSSFQQGKIQSAKDSERDKALFLSALNNAEVSSEYAQTLRSTFEDECHRTATTREWRPQSLAKVESCVADLGAISKKFQELIDHGLTQLRANVLKPRVKPFVDNFAAVSHDISEEDFANYEANDPWVQALIVCVDGLLASFRESLTPNNYDGLVGQLTTEIVTRLERPLPSRHSIDWAGYSLIKSYGVWSHICHPPPIGLSETNSPKSPKLPPFSIWKCLPRWKSCGAEAREAGSAEEDRGVGGPSTRSSP